jgi:hypothetical protein
LIPDVQPFHASRDVTVPVAADRVKVGSCR